MKTIFVIFLVCLFFVDFVFPQNKSDKTIVQKSIIITANVAVVDSAGNFVNDIKPEDIKVFEDGIEQKITHLTKKEPILNLGLVFDNSGSMRQNLEKITGLSSVFADFLTGGNEAFVVRFVNSDKIEMFQDWTFSKTLLTEAVDNLFIEGGQSAVLDAVYLSAEKILERERQNSSKRSAIILVSDAEERDSYHSFEETMSLFKGTDLQIFLLSFAENAPLAKKKARSLGNILTFETGGTIYSLPKKNSKEDILNALRSISGELRSQYVIKYTSTNQKRDGLPRKLTVQISDGEKGEKRTGLIRDGFVIPKE